MDFKQNIARAEQHLSNKDLVLRKLIELYGPCDITPHKDHYGELIGSIVGQQLSTRAAAAIWLRVLQLFGGKMPSPEQLMAVKDQKLRDIGLSWAKVSYVKDLAQHVIDKRLDLNQISIMPNEDLIVQLTAVKGIGQWSAHMFMIFGLGRLDILPTGDLGIKKAIMINYGLEKLPDPATCVAVATKNKWNPYESVASWYLWKSLDADNPDKQTRHNV